MLFRHTSLRSGFTEILLFYLMREKAPWLFMFSVAYNEYFSNLSSWYFYIVFILYLFLLWNRSTEDTT